MGLLRQTLAAPYFFFSIFVFYWSLPLFAIVYRIRFLQMSGKRRDMYEWSSCMRKFFGVTVLKYGQQSLFKGSGNCMYLCNHRSWADFFLDVYLTEGNSALMSRMMVAVAFPIFITSVAILKGIVLFKRGTIADKEKFNAWLDDKLATSPIPGLLVYPEGHRSTRPTSLPLKRGMLHYAYSRKLPVQVIISSGKEVVMSEKTRRAAHGATLVVGYSPVVNASAFSDFNAFATEVQRVWDAMWGDVYSADPAGLPPLTLDNVPEFDYPPDMRHKQAAITLFSIGVLAAVLFFTGRGVLLVLGSMGVVGQIIGVLLAAWFITSVAVCRAPPPKAAAAAATKKGQ